MLQCGIHFVLKALKVLWLEGGVGLWQLSPEMLDRPGWDQATTVELLPYPVEDTELDISCRTSTRPSRRDGTKLLL